MHGFKKTLLALSGLALLVVTLAHPLVPVGAASNDKGPRRFYLTRTTHTGAQALSACAAGYHMASLWEIFDPSNFRYDTELGVTQADSGFGPPSLSLPNLGWIRTGYVADVDTPPGVGNCNVWTSAVEPHFGTVAGLNSSWATGGDVSVISPWRAATAGCHVPRNVWCVQD